MAKLDPWIKVKTVHVLDEYNDLSDKEFRAWIKLMALACRLEHMPTPQQMTDKVHYKTIESLDYALTTHQTTLNDILNEVLKDVQGMLRNREHQKQKMQAYRSGLSNVTGNVTVTLPNREEKIREDKNKHIGKTKKPPFSPPSATDVSDYCKERKNAVNVQTFISHYESNGWMVGKNKMKDWKAAIRTWEQRGGDDGRRGKGNSGGRSGVSYPPEWKGTERPAPLSKAESIAVLDAIREFSGSGPCSGDVPPGMQGGE